MAQRDGSGSLTDLIITADDYGLSEAVNEGVEQAHRFGVLGSASLMVGERAAQDAITRSSRLPGLRVGLHLVLVDGHAVLPRSRIPDLVDGDGRFPADQTRPGFRYAFDRSVKRQLEAEITAQFEAFAATGLELDHADAHKHMHLHPVVGSMMIRIGARFGLRGIRVPAEPPAIMAALGTRRTPAASALYAWSGVLRRQALRSGLIAPDAVFGIAWTGHMTEARLIQLAPRLPAGVVELYFHPAVRRDATLDRLMPGYDHEGELAALCSPRLRAAFAAADPASYGQLAEKCRSTSPVAA